MSDIQLLFPRPEVVRVGRRRVQILPVTLRHFEQFGAASSDVMALLGNYSVEEIYAYATKTGTLRFILRTCTSLGWWGRRQLPAATAVELMVHVVRVNSGFFGKALLQAASAVPGPNQPSA